MDPHIYFIRDDDLMWSDLGRSESLYSIGNGNIGCRGFHLDRMEVAEPALYMNGFYELTEISYGESAFGYARHHQTMLSLPDIRTFKVYINGALAACSLKSAGYTRMLDMSDGCFSYKYIYDTIDGTRAGISVETLFSMTSRDLGAVRLTLSLSRPAHIEIVHSIEYLKNRHADGNDPRKQTAAARTLLGSNYYLYHMNGDCDGMSGDFQSHNSALTLHVGSHDMFDEGFTTSESSYNDEGYPMITYSFDTSHIVCTSVFYYISTREPHKSLSHQQINEIQSHLCLHSFDSLLESNKEYYHRFWALSDVTVKGDDQIQRALRLNLFQLHQSTGNDGKTSLSAKGLTGSGYEGHYFWDTEIYGMPFFILTDPSLARNLIRYRIRTLPAARRRAKEMNQKGALFPWRTINGEEASAFFPAGTAQYHINADIAYSLLLYLTVTEDWDLMCEGGGELLFETARFYYDLGFFNPARGGKFCINEVTGPDEYSALVDNNTYTNAMVRHHLLNAAAVYRKLASLYPGRLEAIKRKIHLTSKETDQWEHAAHLIYLPFDMNLKISAQDDQFLYRQIWDTEKKGPIRHPMLLHYHPLVIYRHQVIKQSDTVLAMFLLSDTFPWYLRKRNFDYYHPLTTGDSSLSDCIEGIAAFDCGRIEEGFGYLRRTILLDFLDSHNNTQDGLHTAAMGGSWMAVVFGIAGLRIREDHLFFRPQLPESIHLISFSLQFKSEVLHVSVGRKVTTYSCDGRIKVQHRSTMVELNKNEVSLDTCASIKGVIFDLDGVITSTDEFHFLAWKRLCDEHGWKFNRALNRQLRGISREESLKVIEEYNHLCFSQKQIEELTAMKNEMYVRYLDSLDSSDILPGIPELLKELKEHHIATAVASASRNARFILDKLKIAGQFDHIVDANEVEKGKPDPEVFVRASDALGLLPEECAAVEDSDAGLQAIKSAMMKSVGVGEDIDLTLCDVSVKSTEELSMTKMLF
ncbi:MAG: beta-phosphoglucomutase [Sphaerochaetaceae bacterium]|nr:beta-phosphoglucomutase [Sphaerochaetaceae bacterium]